MDAYETIGVSKDATDDEIKRTYRKKALDAHPDRNGNDGEQIKQLNHAFSLIGDPAKRREYDEHGETDRDPRDPVITVLVNMFRLVFTDVMRDGMDLERCDLIKLIRNKLASQRTEATGAVAELSKRCDKLRKVADRFQSKDEDNIFVSSLKSEIQQMEHQVKIAERNAAVLKEAEKRLKKYKYKFDGRSMSKSEMSTVWGNGVFVFKASTSTM